MSETKTAISLDPQTEASILQNAADDILRQAAKLGASQAEVAISNSVGCSVTVRMGEIETVEYQRDKGVGITVYFGEQKGSASSTDISSDSLGATLTAACDIAKCTGKDPYSGLADKDRMAWDYPELNLFHPWNVDTADLIALAKECEDHGRAHDKRIVNSDGATVSTSQSLQLYANSNGFSGFVPTTRHNVSCMLVAGEGDTMQRDYYYHSARDAADLMNVQKLAEQAATRACQRLGARKVPTASVPVIFEADIAKTLFRSFLGAISGRALYRNASFLVDHIDKPVFSEKMHLYERPHLVKGLSSAPFDGEGVATYDKDFIVDGILRNYVLGSYSARRLNMASTGNAGGVCNLIVAHDDLSQSALIKQMGKGLIVRELLGQGVNLVTGDYSRGAAGFWVENGEIQYPVDEITIAGRLQDMFMSLVAIANDVDTRGSIHTGSVLLEKMMVAGD